MFGTCHFLEKKPTKKCTRAPGTHEILVWTHHNFILQLQCKDLWVCQSFTYMHYVSNWISCITSYYKNDWIMCYYMFPYLYIVNFELKCNWQGAIVVVILCSWIYIYLQKCICNQCLSPVKLWFRISLRRGVLDTTLCDKVCQWLAAEYRQIYGLLRVLRFPPPIKLNTTI